MNQNAVNYLKENKEKYSKEILIKQLQNSGYGEEDIDEAVKTVFGDAISAGISPTGEVKYAGFWVRWVAVFLDGIIVNVAYGIVVAPIFVVVGFSTASTEDNPMLSLASFIMYPIAWAYYIFMTNKYQATIGKMALGLVVLKEDGQRAELGKIVLRETVGKILSAITLGIGYIMAGFTKKKQALHDMVAGTVVVYKDPSKKMKGWVVGVVIAAVILFMVAVVGILASIVLVSLNGAKGKAQDVTVKAVVSAAVPQALVYYDENKSFEGFKPKKEGEGSMIECVGANPIINVASDGQRIAIFGKLCSEDNTYFCADTSSNSNGIGSTAEVDEAFVKSGKTSCE